MAAAASARRSDWKWWTWWTLASTAAWAAGLIVLRTMFRSGGVVPSILGIVLSGSIVGLTQWLVLRLHIKRAGWWVLSTVAGTAAGLALCLLVLVGITYAAEVFDLTARIVPDTWAIVVAVVGIQIGALFGAAVGAAQSIALPWHVRDTGWWVLATVLGAAFDALLLQGAVSAWGLGADTAAALERSLATALLAAFGGPFKGGFTAIALVWLLKERP